MISLRSEVYPDFFKNKITYEDRLFFIGSCFAENIGQNIISAKFSTVLNPFGIMYNPESVKNALEMIIKKAPFTENQLTFYNEKWISFSHHGIFSGLDKDAVLKEINRSIELSNDFLSKADFLFITFGTAWVYQLKKTREIVANCHKVKADEFEHFILETEDIVKTYKKLFADLFQLNPKLKIIFTVSPVRHWKDGPANNQLSKATLITAVHKLVKELEQLYYFPSYEIMMDDLRDYRFYANDLFHPNSLAIDYIWEKFSVTFLDKAAIEIVRKINQLTKNVEHKVFYPQTEAYRKFIENNLKLINELKAEYPLLDFSNEEFHFINEQKKYFSDGE